MQLAGHPVMPLWDSETGFTCGSSYTKFYLPFGNDPVNVAKTFPKSLAAIYAADIERVYYYTGSPSTHAGDEGHRWLCDLNRVVKRPSVSLAVTVSILTGTTFLEQRYDQTTPDLVHLVFQNSTVKIHMLWSKGASLQWTPQPTYSQVLSTWGRSITESTYTLTDAPIYAIEPE